MTDLEFIHRCVRGDKRSWNEFIEKYSRLIYNYIHSVLKMEGLVVTQENINELFQEIFFSLIKDNFKKLRSFKARNGCSLASWLRQVTINFTIDYIRKFRPSVSMDEENSDGFNFKEILVNHSLSIPKMLTQNELLEHLRECIEWLDRNDKYFLELHINRGLTLEELKNHFRISRGAIDMRKTRVIDKLKKCFKSKGFLLDF